MRFTYCPSCGKGVKKSGPNSETCPSCKKAWFHNPAPASAVLLVNEHCEVLLGKRKFPPRAGYWDTIGGFLQDNETIEYGARREVREETGIRIRDIYYFGSYPSEYRFRGLEYPVINLVFLTSISSSTKFCPSDDVSEVRFFHPKNFPWKELAFPWCAKVLRDYQKSQKVL